MILYNKGGDFMKHKFYLILGFLFIICLVGCGEKVTSVDYIHDYATVIDLQHTIDPDHKCVQDKSGHWTHNQDLNYNGHNCSIEYSGKIYQYKDLSIYKLCEKNKSIPITFAIYKYKDGSIKEDIIAIDNRVINGDKVKTQYTIN